LTPSRTLTLASAPHEAELMIATRLSNSAFKGALDTLPIGSVVRLNGPKGEMTLHEDPARPAVFLAGGIGVTPFLSIAKDAASRKLPHRITLFYSNRGLNDAAFLSDLQKLEKANPNFRLIAAITEPPATGQAWSGEPGLINQEMLQRHVPDTRAPIYYFAGPPAMTSAMREMLKKMGIAERDTRSEEFYGY
jgi:ferredoxin-NADP reductase